MRQFFRRVPSSYTRLLRWRTAWRAPCISPSDCRAVRFIRNETVPNSLGDTLFARIRQEKKFYVDKTRYAVELLSYERALLLRPPRMGKSLFINMLECLFDVRFKKDFNELFGDLYVGKNKPAEANKLYVLSIVLPPRVYPDHDYMFRSHVMDSIDSFFTYHSEVLDILKSSYKFVDNTKKDKVNSILNQIANHVGPDRRI